MVAVVSARTQLRKQGRALHGPLPVPRGADAELLGQRRTTSSSTASAAAGRRPDLVRPRDREPRLLRRDRVARRPVQACSSSTRRRSPQLDEERAGGRAAARAARPGGVVLRALSVGLAGRRLARDYLAGRGLGEAVCREFRLGFALGGDAARPQGAREGVHRATSSTRPGWPSRRGDDYFQQRLLFPLADARGRIVGFQARKLREDDPLAREVRELARGRALPQGRPALRARTCARAAIAKAGRAVVAEGNTDVIALRQAGLRARGRGDGDGAHRAQLKELGRLTHALVPLLRRRRGRRGGDAARDGARRRAGLRPAGRRDAAGARPRRRRRRLRGAPRARRAVRVYRVRIEIERAPDQRAAYERVQEVLDALAGLARSGRRRGGSRTTGST